MYDFNEKGRTVNIDSNCGCANYWIEERVLEKSEYTRRLRSAAQSKCVRTQVSKTSLKCRDWTVGITTGVERERHIEFLFSCGIKRSSANYRHDGNFEIGSPAYDELVVMLAERHASNMDTTGELEAMLADFDL